ncbi:MAG: hypothetical protein G01um101420_906 [Parcubacteria group bacterium Gr01-1014_20]|nr:MAG: hypothetical protein G01um101420_906 [Parcubacteria group bacterium Gr01-1014_20]
MNDLINKFRTLKGLALQLVAFLPFTTSRPFPIYGLAAITHAASEPPPIDSVADIISVINQIGVWVGTIFWIAAAMSIFYAGFIYMTAADDTEKVKKAKKQLLYSIIAIALGIMAYGFPVLVRSILESRVAQPAP